MNKNLFMVGEASAEWASRAQLEHHYSPTLASTNDLAKEEAQSLNSAIKIYFTDEQSAGRGRGSNSWLTPGVGSGLLMTLSYRLSEAPQPQLTPLVGLAVFRALLASYPDLDISLKAPNDLLLSGKKLAGLLTEVVSSGGRHRLILGLGLNVFAAPDLPEVVYLTQKTKHLNPTEWGHFLDRLLLEVTMVMASRPREISPHARGVLKFALNQNPLLTEKVHEITALGDLHFSNHTKKWSEL